MADRGEKMRLALLQCAVSRFAEKGYDVASTREIATAAGTTLPSISYHFGSKEGLYAAALQQVAELVTTSLTPVQRDISDALANQKLPHSSALKLLQHLLSSYALLVLSGPHDRSRLIMRELLNPTIASAPLAETIKQHYGIPLVRLISRLTQRSVDDEKVRLQALMLTGRLTGLSFNLTGTLEFMGWSALTPERVETVISTLHDEVSMLFGRDHA